MNLAVQLGPTDRDEARPFAHIEHNVEDLQAMIIMAAHLRQLLVESVLPEPAGPYHIHEMTSSHGRWLRLSARFPRGRRALPRIARVCSAGWPISCSSTRTTSRGSW